MFSAYRFQQDTNFKHEKIRVYKGIFFLSMFSKFVFGGCKGPGLIDFPDKREPD